MEFEFDPAKDASNRTKHGVSLAFGARVFDGPHVVLSPIRPIDGEFRYKAVGLVDGGCGRRFTSGETVRCV